MTFVVLSTAFFGQDSKPETQTDSSLDKPTTSQPAAQPGPAPDAKKTDQPPPATAQPTGPVDPAQAQLMADTAKLVKLSQELKAEVAKSNKDTLSLAVIKKADEVEKLAKSVKERLNKAH